MALPLVLTVFLVLCGTLSLCVGLILSLELLHTFILVHGLTLFLIHCGALLSCGWLAQALGLCSANLLIFCGTNFSFCLCILCIPDGGVLCNTLDRPLSPEGSSSWTVLYSSILWSSTCQTE